MKVWWYPVMVLVACAPASARGDKRAAPEPSALDRYAAEARARGARSAPATPGSLWSPSSRYADLAGDLRASQPDDLLTILVAERATAVSSGSVKTTRKSDVKSSVSALAGVTRATGPWANLAGAGTATQLDGQGATTRETTVTTTLSARVVDVLPNGYLLIEGVRELEINSERQLITVRGVVRPADLGPGNVVASDHIAQLEVRINGKGVVGDAIKRPFFLYRLLLGLLPF